METTYLKATLLPLSIAKGLWQIVLYRCYFEKTFCACGDSGHRETSSDVHITEQPVKKDEPHLDTRDASGPSEENHSPYISSEENSSP